ncbi:DNA-directed RNA polymerase subunit beta' [Flavobacteriales bacterium]|nr:DNA-directed RNA polymerase subunit beta' [Flavobacteriales bacterium]
MRNTKNNRQAQDIKAIKISLSSPEDILEKSSGEVTKPETINYRTYKPESGGLFCERVFGPTKDFECHCGKYKRIRYRGIVCDRCGVEVTEKKVRRERIGHINLVVPVAHIWYFRTLPNKIGYLLGLPSKRLDMIIYYERYVVINAPEGIVNAEGEEVKYLDFLTEEEYLDILDAQPLENQYLSEDDPKKFVAKMGAEAIHNLLAKINLDDLSYALRDQAENETSQQRKKEALKRLQIVESMRDGHTHTENRPEWMTVKVIPVIPPELRPLVPLDGGRFATSDLNDLYRRVIIRNNRLKRLMEINAPEIILRNEKRMLQESVDALFDNSRKSSAVKADGKRALKSLSDSLKGKQGRFRQNLLGKRVDYSARSVIVVGPELELHECGIPKDMAAELYKPFIIRKLIERGIVKTVKSAKKIIDTREPVVWDILENVMKGHPVLLNRAPTLHRLGIQAFQPKMIEGKAIQLHPLACAAFNADFDGDQMAVHLPLGAAAILEAQVLMLASHNILNPANGAPITVPSQDMVLGLYYMTKEKRSTDEEKVKGEGMTFYSLDEVKIAYNEKVIDLHAVIKVRVTNAKGKKYLVETSVGRVLFNEYVPKEVEFVNELLTKKALRNIIGDVLETCGVSATVHFLDAIKTIGFNMAFRGGLSFNLGDVLVPEEKEGLITDANKKVDEIKGNYEMGFITNNERYNQVIDVWTTTNARLTDIVMRNISSDKQGFNSVYMMLDSGARGSKEQIRQLSGMRGLMAKPKKSGDHGESIIENPITTNFREGLSILEYFISTHGARKGLADTALKTADAGYLTRRLVDVAQDVIVTEDDCETLRGLEVFALKNNDDIVEPLSDRISGRVSLHDVFHPKTEKLMVASNDMITDTVAKAIDTAGIEMVEVRSALTCQTRRGICKKCYGKSLSTNRMAQVGESVGVVAAQSVGEPGTQLTLRTFHVGGTASRAEVDSSLTVKKDGRLEIEDLRTVKSKDNDGKAIEIVVSRSAETKVVDDKNGVILSTNIVPYGSTIFIKDGAVKKGDVICEWDPYNAVIISEVSGAVEFNDIEQGVSFRVESDEQTGHQEKVIIDSRNKKISPSITIGDRTYTIPVGAHLSVDNSKKVKAGEILAKIPRSAGSSGDITGGLPRVTEMFEARNPSNPAVVSEVDGSVSFGKIKRGNREVIISTKAGETKKYLIKLAKHILVQENDYVKAGMPLCEGVITPSDILAIKGVVEVQQYIVNEIQDVYRLQGVKINDKHFEVLVRQMMRKVSISHSGDTYFLEGSLVGKAKFHEQNDKLFGMMIVTETGDSEELQKGQIVSPRQLREENSRLKRKDAKEVEAREAMPAIATSVLQGITRASLQVDSWISAASFQQTTKVLNEAAINAKRDHLIGLKENVIIGKKIPAGTGLVQAADTVVGSQVEYDRLMQLKEESANAFEPEEELVVEGEISEEVVADTKSTEK